MVVGKDYGFIRSVTRKEKKTKKKQAFQLVTAFNSGATALLSGYSVKQHPPLCPRSVHYQSNS